MPIGELLDFNRENPYDPGGAYKGLFPGPKLAL